MLNCKSTLYIQLNKTHNFLFTILIVAHLFSVLIFNQCVWTDRVSLRYSKGEGGGGGGGYDGKEPYSLSKRVFQLSLYSARTSLFLVFFGKYRFIPHYDN